MNNPAKFSGHVDMNVYSLEPRPSLAKGYKYKSNPILMLISPHRTARHISICHKRSLNHIYYSCVNNGPSKRHQAVGRGGVMPNIYLYCLFCVWNVLSARYDGFWPAVIYIPRGLRTFLRHPPKTWFSHFMAHFT